MQVDTDIEPPGLDDDEDDDGPPRMSLSVSILEGDGTYRTGNTNLAVETTDAELAEALVACVRGLAAMRGPGLVAAVEHQLRKAGGT